MHARKINQAGFIASSFIHSLIHLFCRSGYYLTRPSPTHASIIIFYWNKNNSHDTNFKELFVGSHIFTSLIQFLISAHFFWELLNMRKHVLENYSLWDKLQRFPYSSIAYASTYAGTQKVLMWIPQKLWKFICCWIRFPSSSSYYWFVSRKKVWS